MVVPEEQRYSEMVHPQYPDWEGEFVTSILYTSRIFAMNLGNQNMSNN